MAKILVIDDSFEVIDVISRLFEMRRPEDVILTARDGESGIDMVETESPDVVILDIGMPGIDGFDVCREIRRFSSVPVLILTVHNTPEAMQLARQVGANDYMIKPFSAEELLQHVVAAIESPADK